MERIDFLAPRRRLLLGRTPRQKRTNCVKHRWIPYNMAQ
jgi:hypothetical protein